MISWKTEAIGGWRSEKGGSATERADTKVNLIISWICSHIFLDFLLYYFMDFQMYYFWNFVYYLLNFQFSGFVIVSYFLIKRFFGYHLRFLIVGFSIALFLGYCFLECLEGLLWYLSNCLIWSLWWLFLIRGKITHNPCFCSRASFKWKITFKAWFPPQANPRLRHSCWKLSQNYLILTAAN